MFWNNRVCFLVYKRVIDFGSLYQNARGMCDAVKRFNYIHRVLWLYIFLCTSPCLEACCMQVMDIFVNSRPWVSILASWWSLHCLQNLILCLDLRKTFLFVCLHFFFFLNQHQVWLLNTHFESTADVKYWEQCKLLYPVIIKHFFACFFLPSISSNSELNRLLAVISGNIGLYVHRNH